MVWVTRYEAEQRARNLLGPRCFRGIVSKNIVDETVASLPFRVYRGDVRLHSTSNMKAILFPKILAAGMPLTESEIASAPEEEAEVHEDPRLWFNVTEVEQMTRALGWKGQVLDVLDCLSRRTTYYPRSDPKKGYTEYLTSDLAEVVGDLLEKEKVKEQASKRAEAKAKAEAEVRAEAEAARIKAAKRWWRCCLCASKSESVQA